LLEFYARWFVVVLAASIFFFRFPFPRRLYFGSLLHNLQTASPLIALNRTFASTFPHAFPRLFSLYRPIFFLYCVMLQFSIFLPLLRRILLRGSHWSFAKTRKTGSSIHYPPEGRTLFQPILQGSLTHQLDHESTIAPVLNVGGFVPSQPVPPFPFVFSPFFCSFCATMPQLGPNLADFFTYPKGSGAAIPRFFFSLLSVFSVWAELIVRVF